MITDRSRSRPRSADDAPVDGVYRCASGMSDGCSGRPRVGIRPPDGVWVSLDDARDRTPGHSPRNRAGSSTARPRPGPTTDRVDDRLPGVADQAPGDVRRRGRVHHVHHRSFVQACDTRKVSRPLVSSSSSMRRNRFRSTSAANSRCASVASVDGHIVVHPRRCQRPARCHFDHPTTSGRGYIVITPFCPPSGTSGRASLIFATILIVTLSPVSSQSTIPNRPFRAVGPVDRNLIDERSAVVAYRPTVRNQIFEHIGVDYAVLPVGLVPPEPLSRGCVVVTAP